MNNFFFVDGPSLLADIKSLRRADATLEGRRLDLVKFASYFAKDNFHQFHDGGYRRFTVYFAAGDDRVEEDLVVPDLMQPGEVEDLRIERCGRTVRDVARVREWLDEVDAPEFVRECLHRSEKAVDTQICVDALQLASRDKLDRLFLYTNDSDFVPLCRTLRQLGCNVNLFRLQAAKTNKALVHECDAFHDMTPHRLQQAFHPTPVPET